MLYRVDGTIVTSGGLPAGPVNGRLAVALHDVDGCELAVVVADPSLARHRELLDAVVASASLGIANAGLRAAALVQLAEVRASQRRIVESGMAARRVLERDLHDGAQQRLLAVSASLSRAWMAEGTSAREVLDETRDELRRAIAELRDLARGVHPARPSQSGLEAALADVGAGCPVPVTLDVEPGRWAAAVEVTSYFVVCEALNNAVKHASASHVTVTMHGRDGALAVSVSDDGVGGADADGHGLQALRDRVGAMAGELSVTSSAGCGTTITAVIPCA